MSDTEFKVEIPALTNPWPSDFEMTEQEMVDFNLEHARKFLEGDIDGIMEQSLIDVPVWEFYPNRIRLTGKEAVRRYHEINYKVVIEQVDPRTHGEDTREFYSHTSGPNVISHEFSCMMHMKNGTSFRGYFLAVIPYQNGRMVGERVWMDKCTAEWFEESFDRAFFTIPGVERF